MNALFVLPPLSVVLLIVVTTGVGCYVLRQRTVRFAAPHDIAALVVIGAIVGLTTAAAGELPGPAWLPAAVVMTTVASILLRRLGQSITQAGAVIDQTIAELAGTGDHPAPSYEVRQHTASQGAGSGRRRSLRTAAR